MKLTKKKLKRLRALLAAVPNGPWIVQDGDVVRAAKKLPPHLRYQAEQIVYAYPNEGGGAASQEIAEYIALLDPPMVRELLSWAIDGLTAQGRLSYSDRI